MKTLAIYYDVIFSIQLYYLDRLLLLIRAEPPSFALTSYPNPQSSSYPQYDISIYDNPTLIDFPDVFPLILLTVPTY